MSVKIIVGDCRLEMKAIESGSIDCIISDPPYGETGLDWDSEAIWGWQEEALRVLAPHGSMWLFGSFKFLANATRHLTEWNIAQDVIWEKHNGANLLRDRFRRVHEMAVQFYPKSRKWRDVYKKPIYTGDAVANSVRHKRKPGHWGDTSGEIFRSEDGGQRLMRSVMFCRSEHGRAVHPTQKPIPCVAPLVEYSCAPGGMVLDMFAGSGTTGLAAKTLGRNAILIEVSPEYAKIAQKRLDADAPLLEVAS